MISLLGREARRIPGTCGFSLRSVRLVLGCSQVSNQWRTCGTSGLCFDGHDEPGLGGKRLELGEQGRAVSVAQYLPITGDVWEAWILANTAETLQASSVRVSEVLKGLKQATTGLLKSWTSSFAPRGVADLAFPVRSQPTVLPQPELHHQEGEEEESMQEGLAGIFEEGLWATSVKRKRVTKMRKHKWRKRRKLERQSASRRANN